MAVTSHCYIILTRRFAPRLVFRSSAHCSSLRSSQVRGIYGGVVADWLSRGYDLDEGTIERGLEELKAIGAVDVEKKEWEVSGGAKISQQIIHIFLTRFL